MVDTTPHTDSPSPLKAPRSAFERFTPPLIMAGLLALAVAIIFYAKQHIDLKTKPAYEGSLPMTGSFATITDIQTGWKKVPKGENTNDYLLHPTATITLGSDCAQPTGSLLLIFYSTERDLSNKPMAAGDNITLPYRDGKFANGETSITIVGNTPLGGLADLLTYRDQDTDRWTIEVLEGDGSSKYQAIGHAPISPIVVP